VHRELWNEKTRLKALALTREMHGVPINMPFTDLSDITETLKATHVHENEDEKVRFALAVRVFAYPNRVYSVWLYAVSLVRRTA
jgi:coiled-coil and C2 domain-containing protein 2A